MRKSRALDRLPSLRDIRAELQRREEEEQAILCKRAKTEYLAYVEYVHRGRWKPAKHNLLICDYLQRVEAGEIDRIMFTMPPRHGKSMTITETFPSWFIGRDPNRRVIEVSYNDHFARKFGRANRRKIVEFGEEIFGVQVSQENRSVTSWGVCRDINGEFIPEPGGMISSGVCGTITGEGADLLLIDDPIKNRQEAESETYRESLWSEWQDTMLTRLHAGGSVILIMTRWHDDDLAGRLIREGGWTVVNLPALAEDEDILDRQVGEALWPDHGYDEVWAERKKAEVGSRTWLALYQGRPSAAEGNLFKRQFFRKFRARSEGFFELITDTGIRIVERSSCRIFQTCDVAGSTKSSADFFVVGTFALTPHNEILILDIFRTRLEGPDQPAHMRRLFEEWRPLIQGVESKNMGLTLFQQLRRDGNPIIELKAEADKYTRAIPAAARYEVGSIYHLDGAPWRDVLEDELISFPTGAHDDQVDVVSYAVLVQLWGYLSNKDKQKDRAYVFG